MNPANEPIGRKSNSTMAIGAFLFLGGAILMIGSYGTGAPFAVPMMIIGAAFPFVYSYMVRHGADWDEVRSDRPVVMSRREGNRKLRQQAGERFEDTSHRIPAGSYEIDSTRYHSQSRMF